MPEAANACQMLYMNPPSDVIQAQDGNGRDILGPKVADAKSDWDKQGARG